MSDEPIMTAKNVLRKKLFSVINNLPKHEIIRQSKIVTDKVKENVEFKKAKVVSIYLSMDNEIQTEDLVRLIFEQGKECFIPRSAIIVDDFKVSRLDSRQRALFEPKGKHNSSPVYGAIRKRWPA